MLDLMKRLQELDSANPNVVNETEQKVEECGMMPEVGMAMDRPSTPASINMTAGSAAELGDLLKDIVSLAGMDKPELDMPLSVGGPAVLEPAGMGTPGADDMRSVIDKLNPMDGDDDQDSSGDDQEADKEKVDELDNEPADPTKPPPFDANQYANKENQPGQGDRMDGNMPKGNPTMNFESLMAEYKRFVAES